MRPLDRPWCGRVWKEDEHWHWDVRSPGLRCTGERATWREAFDCAVAELDQMRAAVVTHRGLRSRGMARGAFASPWRIDDDGRECSACGSYQDWEEFAPSSPKQPHGRQSACRGCRGDKYPTKHAPGEHRARVLAKFSLTLGDYAWLFEQQGGKCALCLRPESKTDYRTGRVWWLSVDHDHSCHPAKRGCKRCIRGLLCADCNMLLGLAERVGGPVIVRFSDYLERRPFL